MITQNKDADSGSGRVSVLELEATEIVSSCRSTYVWPRRMKECGWWGVRGPPGSHARVGIMITAMPTLL